VSEYRIAVDVGGTFTDVAAIGADGRLSYAKAPSTPENQATGVLDGLARLAERLDLSLPALLSRTGRIVHGMTVATNALIERKVAKVGLLTTAGHRDVLEMREGLKPERYDLRLPRPGPLVPRDLRLGVSERLRADGRVETPLDARSVERAVRRLARARVGAIAVCYLHAYRDPSHERATRQVIERLYPGVYVSLSSEVLPQIKEYQRVATTVVNAYVGPLIERYLRSLEDALARQGFDGPLLVMLSHGGVAPVAEAARIAAGTVLSGPAGGVAGARHIARLMGTRDVIALDMGGTSTDISLVLDGEAALSSTRAIAHEPVALPSLDIITLGAGGGSLGRAGEGGLLRVGPESAGAVPGPAAYGQGGRLATVTDASVVLGYLDPGAFLGGRRKLDAGAAQAALASLGASLGVDAVAAAEGVHRVVNTHMAEGIRLATVRRGVDPRRFALLGFGGAAGLHATALARALEIGRVVVPSVASVLSAWGMLASELRFEAIRTHIGETDSLDLEALEAIFAEMEVAGRTRMGQWFDGEIECRRSADMRYGEQIFEIDVALEGLELSAPGARTALKAVFEARHRALYTYALEDQAPVLVNARVATVGRLDGSPGSPAADASSPASRAPGRVGPAPPRRRIYLGGWLEAPVHDFSTLSSGAAIEGPAIIESDTTTVLLRAPDRARVTGQGWLDIEVGADD